MTFNFRDLEKKDLEWARQLHNDPEVLAMLTDPTVVSKTQQEQWFKKLQKSNSSWRWVVENEKKERIGLVRLDNIDRYNHSICIGMDIVKEFRGKGLAKSIYISLMNNLFYNYCFHRLWLLVADYNKRAYHIYHSLGFKQEGRHRDGLYKKGKYHDYILMGILDKEFNYNV